MPLKEITAASVLPVTLLEAKTQCRIMDGDTTHDDRLTSIIWQAAATIESLIDCKTSATTMELVLDEFPNGDIEIPLYPVTAISSVKYDDADDVEQTMLVADYWTQLAGYRPMLRAVTSWPATKACKPGAVRIQFVVGFTAATLPKDLKQAILMRVGEFFDQKGESVTGPEVFETVNSVEHLIGPHRRAYV